MSSELHRLVERLLNGSPQFLGEIQASSGSLPELLAAIQQWSHALSRDFSDVIRVFEPSFRQSVLMSLLPARALHPSYGGSYDAAIEEHLAALGLKLDAKCIAQLRNLIINLRRLQGLDARSARNLSASLPTVKATTHYARIRKAQGNRCCWCGVDLDSPGVGESLEHLVPKHLGDDPADGSNWALACTTCNSGKGDALAWSATQWAHDYVRRNQLADPDVLEREHRWVVLRRAERCDTCRVGPQSAELFVYRRVRSGLPIPANCSVTCKDCGVRLGREILRVAWADIEGDRARHQEIGAQGGAPDDAVANG
jgi:hypothetical protein